MKRKKMLSITDTNLAQQKKCNMKNKIKSIKFKGVFTSII